MVSLSDNSSFNYQAYEMPRILDPSIIRAARQIYRTYCVLNAKITRRPSGVAIDKDSYRGQLIFKNKPILLPGECFVPLKQLEAEI
jgi:hypothetical protein